MQKPRYTQISLAPPDITAIHVVYAEHFSVVWITPQKQVMNTAGKGWKTTYSKRVQPLQLISALMRHNVKPLPCSITYKYCSGKIIDYG